MGIYEHVCAALFEAIFTVFCLYSGLLRFIGGLQRLMKKPMRFLEKPHQGLSNAPSPKFFGQKLAEIKGNEDS